MKEEMDVHAKLIEAGADDSFLDKYRKYQENGDGQGQERLICRCMREKSAELKREREQLACLDYMIAKVEETYGE